MKDSPHSFIIVIYFNITSGSKVDAKIDLHSYVSLQEFNEGMNKKVNKTDYASAEQYGIVKYGAEEGTVLEGNKFTQMMGKDYGGILNEPGTKEVGKTYFDKNTKKLYLCKNTNTDISANINNYIAMDSHSILERLENLIKVEVIQMTNLLDYVAGLNITEWYAPLPSHIDVNKIVSVTNINQGNWGEYCNLDIKAKTLRVGALGNGKNYPLDQLQVIVAYLA